MTEHPSELQDPSGGDGPLPRDDIERELARVLASALFGRSPRHRQFLRYVVERTLQGRSEKLKELALGVAVFGRPKGTYDPRRDPIVRVEAARLREKLALYYATEGAGSKIEISVPRGSYVPRFERRPPARHGADASPRVAVDAGARRKVRHTPDPRARDLYDHGRLVAHQRSPEAYAKAIDLFRRAIAIDDAFASCFVAFAFAQLNQAGLVAAPSEGPFREARAAAERAIALDPDLGDAYAVLAALAWRSDFDWPTAERLHRRAIELAPGSAYAISAYGFALMTRGRFDEAAQFLLRALELDPLNLGLRSVYAQFLTYWRRFDAADAEARAVLNVAPGHAYTQVVIALNCLYGGDATPALEEFRRVIEIVPDHPIGHIGTAAALALDGRSRQAREQIDRVVAQFSARHYSRFHVALACAYLDDADAVQANLEYARQTRDFLFVTAPIDPAFDRLRGDARFGALVGMLGSAPGGAPAG